MSADTQSTAQPSAKDAERFVKIPQALPGQEYKAPKNFQNPLMSKHFAKWLSRYARYEGRYRAILKENGLPEDTVFLAMIESGFGNFAYSRARAVGPWQFISGTGRLFGLKQDFWVDERRDPEKSARAAARYLKALYAEFGDWRLAWAGYNAGEGKVLRGMGYYHTSDYWRLRETRALKRETRNYVPMIHAAILVAKAPQKAEASLPTPWPTRSWLASQRLPSRWLSILATMSAC